MEYFEWMLSDFRFFRKRKGGTWILLEDKATNFRFWKNCLESELKNKESKFTKVKIERW